MSSLASHSIRNAIFLFTIALAIAATALVAAAEETAVPKPVEVATLRGLLALQYPALFQKGATPASVMPPPSVTAEPDPQAGDRADGA